MSQIIRGDRTRLRSAATEQGEHGSYVPASTTAQPPYDLVITPEAASWGYSSLRVLTLNPGQPVNLATDSDEIIVLPLVGGCAVTIENTTFELTGRDSVFTSTTDIAYLPIRSSVQLTSANGATVALPGTRVEQALPFRYLEAEAIDISLRGSGSSTRQVNNFAMGNGMECVKMLATEVITPASNWSSYPPHKHDENIGEETELEEIYYYQFQSAAPPQNEVAREARPVGYQRVYGTADRPIDLLEEVTNGDAVLIPHGWHGPSIAAPSHHMYYLNVMAGPGRERRWGISDDPAHGWVRATWSDQPTDPRLPFYTNSSPDASTHHQPGADRSR